MSICIGDLNVGGCKFGREAVFNYYFGAAVCCMLYFDLETLWRRVKKCLRVLGPGREWGPK